MTVSKALGQNKYVEICLGQQETLFRDSVYSRLHEQRINCSLRRYNGATGKRCVAHDKFLEHGNRFFSDFPMPKSLEGFANQSLYVGVGLQRKQFTNRWYTTKFETDDDMPNYHSTVKPSMTPERKLVYEVFFFFRKLMFVIHLAKHLV